MRGFFANPLASGLLATLLLAIPMFIPLLAFIQLLAPLPILVTSLLAGVAVGLQAAVIPLVAGILFTEEPLQTVVLMLYFNGFPLLAAWLVRGGWTSRQCIGLALLLVLAVLLVGTLGATLWGLDLPTEITQRINLYRDQVVAEGGDALGANPTARADFQQAVHLYAEMMAQFLPSVLLSIWFLIQTVNLTLARRVLAKLGQPLPETGSLTEGRLPHGLIWFFIAAVLCTMGSGNLAYLGANLLMFLTIPYALQGMAVAGAVFSRIGLPTPLRVAFWISLVLFKSLMLTIIVVGILDTWFDFRRLLSPREGSSPSTR